MLSLFSRDFPSLSPATVTRLWDTFARTGDPDLRDQLIRQYIPLVKHHGNRMPEVLPDALERDDLLQAGLVGLLHAVDRYDPTRGVPFTNYASRRIRGAMIDLLRQREGLPRDDNVDWLEVELPADHDPEAATLTEGDTRFLWRLIRQFPARDRRLMELYYEAGWTMQRIGNAFGISEGRVSQLHSDIVHRLKTQMGASR